MEWSAVHFAPPTGVILTPIFLSIGPLPTSQKWTAVFPDEFLDRPTTI